MSKGRRVLFAFCDGAQPTRSLKRALALACLLESELQIVRVMAAYPQHPGAPDEHLPAASRAGRPAVQGDRVTRDWLQGVLGSARAANGHCIRIGDFVKQGAALAAEVDAHLIIMAPLEDGLGRAATALASVARVPVLIVREAMSEEVIVAATDLERVAYPVLQAATQLALRLSAPLIALHNLNPVSVFSAIDLALSSTTRFGQALTELKRRRLERVLRQLPGHATPVLADEADPADAILGEAHGRNADLIVVGARPRSLDAVQPSCVPVRVIDRARCSILVVPLDDEAPRCPSLAWA
jgi:nucleotide-binding universal stress UspA family protein